MVKKRFGTNLISLFYSLYKCRRRSDINYTLKPKFDLKLEKTSENPISWPAFDFEFCGRL